MEEEEKQGRLVLLLNYVNLRCFVPHVRLTYLGYLSLLLWGLKREGRGNNVDVNTGFLQFQTSCHHDALPACLLTLFPPIGSLAACLLV